MTITYYVANPDHLDILKQGVEAWNEWREENHAIIPCLSWADLSGMNLYKANFYKANLRGANLSEANMQGANLQLADLEEAILVKADLHGAQMNSAFLMEANLSKANLFFANLSGADLSRAYLKSTNLRGAWLREARCIKSCFIEADLQEADLSAANLFDADLRKANLNGSYLRLTSLVYADLSNATMERAKVFGASVWDINKEGLTSKDLIITDEGSEITVDDLEVAQFIYLMLNNQKIRDVIETITSKAVLILGRFTPERKVVLDALKDELRRRNYLPIVFDFENSENRSLTETVSLLAKMSKFVIADITDAKSIPQELYAIVPFTPSLPVVPIVLAERKEYGMFESIAEYKSVLQLYRYESPESLLANIIPAIINPAEQKVKELRGK